MIVEKYYGKLTLDFQAGAVDRAYPTGPNGVFKVQGSYLLFGVPAFLGKGLQHTTPKGITDEGLGSCIVGVPRLPQIPNTFTDKKLLLGVSGILGRVLGEPLTTSANIQM